MKRSLLPTFAATLLFAGATQAKLPSPGNSTIPACIVLLPGPGDPGPGWQDFAVELRDVLNIPVGNSIVTLDFSGCPGVHLAEEQASNVILDCAAHKIRAVADAGGHLTLRIRGWVRNDALEGGAQTSSFQAVHVFADPTLMRNITALSPDQNGPGGSGPASEGLDPGDGSLLRRDLLMNPTTAGRSDLNCSGAVDPADLSIFLECLFNDLANAAPQAVGACP